MTGTSENIVRYTAEEVEAMRRRGEGRTDWDTSQEEAMRRRRADPEAPSEPIRRVMRARWRV
jgi:hypothetical protein